MPPESSTHTEPELPGEAAASVPVPLAMGTTLLDRYTIIQVLPGNDGANVYRVAEMRACPHCGVENEGSHNHCGFCGTELPAPRTLLLVERTAPADGEIVPTGFEVSGLTYVFASDAEPAGPAPRRALEWSFAFLSDPGMARARRGDPNEDSVLAFRLSAQHDKTTQELGVFLVADGVGGAAAGEVASRMAAQTIAQELMVALLTPTHDAPFADQDVNDTLCAAISQANQQIIEYGMTHGLALGSTVVLALLRQGHVYIANVGDSRAYLFRDQRLTQITRDHSYVAELATRGEIAADELRTHPQRNLILRSLGDPTGFEVDVFPSETGGIELEAGDKLLLCSDGLWEMLDDERIAHVLAQAPDAAQACAQLVRFANAAGGADNISLVVLQVGGD